MLRVADQPKIYIRLSPDMHRRIRQLAQDEHRSLQQQMVHLIEQAMATGARPGGDDASRPR